MLCWHRWLIQDQRKCGYEDWVNRIFDGPVENSNSFFNKIYVISIILTLGTLGYLINHFFTGGLFYGLCILGMLTSPATALIPMITVVMTGGFFSDVICKTWRTTDRVCSKCSKVKLDLTKRVDLEKTKAERQAQAERLAKETFEMERQNYHLAKESN